MKKRIKRLKRIRDREQQVKFVTRGPRRRPQKQRSRSKHRKPKRKPKASSWDAQMKLSSLNSFFLAEPLLFLLFLGLYGKDKICTENLYFEPKLIFCQPPKVYRLTSNLRVTSFLPILDLEYLNEKKYDPFFTKLIKYVNDNLTRRITD